MLSRCQVYKISRGKRYRGLGGNGTELLGKLALHPLGLDLPVLVLSRPARHAGAQCFVAASKDAIDAATPGAVRTSVGTERPSNTF